MKNNFFLFISLFNCFATFTNIEWKDWKYIGEYNIYDWRFQLFLDLWFKRIFEIRSTQLFKNTCFSGNNEMIIIIVVESSHLVWQTYLSVLVFVVHLESIEFIEIHVLFFILSTKQLWICKAIIRGLYFCKWITKGCAIISRYS